MELYEYWNILKKKRRVFFLAMCVFIVPVLLWQVTQGDRYGSTLLLNVARSGSQQTNDYMYDGFYRLQADERFGDTVVRWLGSPRGGEDILREAGVDTKTSGTDDLSRFFSASRLSSQVIRVEYVTSTEASAGDIAESVTRVLNRYTDELNRDAKDPSWFRVEGSVPVIRDARIPFWKAFSVSAVLGFFFGFWSVMFLEYWEKQNTNNKKQSTDNRE